MNESCNSIIRDNGPGGSVVPLKTTLSTMVDSDTSPRLLALTSKVGKRRLFRKRIWAHVDPAFPDQTRVTFMPDWITNLPSGRVCLMQSDVIQSGSFDQYIQDTQERYSVHLWVAPISLPTHWPRGNWYWPGVTATNWSLKDVLGQWQGVCKAVAA